MKCNRCGGVMVFEKFYGICEEFFGWRCIFCGEIVDQVILENRLEQKRGNPFPEDGYLNLSWKGREDEG